jgi:hypothetical protein
MEKPQELTERNSGVPTGWIILSIVAGAVLLYVLWRLLNYYIASGDDPTQRRDLVQAFAVLAGGLVAAGTLVIGWLNLRNNQRTLLINQRNTQETLRNAQEVENRRAQGSGLQAYFEQMGDLLLDKTCAIHHPTARYAYWHRHKRTPCCRPERGLQTKHNRVLAHLHVGSGIRPNGQSRRCRSKRG